METVWTVAHPVLLVLVALLTGAQAQIGDGNANEFVDTVMYCVQTKYVVLILYLNTLCHNFASKKL